MKEKGKETEDTTRFLVHERHRMNCFFLELELKTHTVTTMAALALYPSRH